MKVEMIYSVNLFFFADHKRSSSVHRERNFSGNQNGTSSASGIASGGSSNTLGQGGTRPRVSSTASEYANQAQLSSSGGLSFTGCLSNFSLYIFHPYGGGQRKPQTVGSPGYSGFQKSELGNFIYSIIDLKPFFKLPTPTFFFFKPFWCQTFFNRFFFFFKSFLFSKLYLLIYF